ncbi:MAG: hypothetical protein H6Q69_2723 [Firmicutes bacterium]|nr:hypothetical protein [Bacillota bacterium]
MEDYFKKCCNEEDYLGYLKELIDYGEIEEDTAAYGITKMIIDGRIDELSQYQWNTFLNYVAKSFYVDSCKRCGASIPWCEMYMAMDNGGYCGFCDHMMNKDD